jgi:putative hydrolase of the HAD superfamily
MWRLFDAVGTLIYADPPVADVYRAAGARFGSVLTADEIRRRFATALQTESGQVGSLSRSPTSEAAEVARWERIVAVVFDEVSTQHASELFESLWNHFAQPQHWRLYDDVAPALQLLASRGIRIGIASNFDSRLRTIIAGLPGLAACERVFVSSDVGFVKPDPRFFAAIQQQLRVPATEISLVGDDWLNDVVGARAAGWQSVWLCREEGPKGEPHIRTLAELP